MTGQGPRESNERLEFLGDSVLGLVTSEYLYRQHPNEHEGQLTKTKSLLVSKAILSRRALAMGLGRFVLMSHSEVESGGRQRLSILADAFESVIGAIYLDQGFEAARAFIERWLLRDSREIVSDKRHTNYKSHLQEYVQSTFRTHPVYRIRSEMGPDHSKHFMVEVLVGRRMLGEGKGRNKKEAEQAAARDALDRVGGEPGNEGRERGPRDRMPREVRERVAPPRVEAEAGGIATADESEESTRRRPRGRRGGRGRRARPGGEMEPAAPSSTMPVAQEPPPPAPVSAARPAAERARDVEPPELEPLPPAYDEDEFEEIGRPEGPLEDRHVDPFAIETEPAAAEERYAAPSGAPAAPAEGAQAGDEPWVETEWSMPGSDSEPSPEPPASGESEVGEESGQGPAPTSTPAGGALYGRRPGRKRRGPSR